MLEQGTYLVPTLSAVHRIVEKGTEAGIPEYAVTKAKRGFDAHLQSFELALEAGVDIAMGTDASTPFNEHGQNLYELELMVEAGMEPLDAITAATSAGAELLGKQKDIGTIEEGKEADLVLIDGDPLADITLLQTAVHGVWKSGVRC
jgi:imidazolonepropionase-like amidohydrolase